MAALGIGLAMLEWSAPVTAVVVVAASGCAAPVLTLATQLLATKSEPTPLGWRRVLSWSWRIGAAVVGLMALVSASPVLALLVVVLAVTTSPVVTWIVAAAPSRADGHSALRGLDDRQLCELWRRTFWDLHHQPTVVDALTMVSLRQACLDELEKRNPAAVQAWLESGARASGGLERFWSPRARSGDADAA